MQTPRKQHFALSFVLFGLLGLALLAVLLFPPAPQSAWAAGAANTPTSTPTPPPAPTLLGPEDNATTTVGNYPPSAVPNFEWQGIAEPAEYRFELSTDPGFAVKRINITTANQRYTPTLSDLADSIYYWRVRIEKVNGKNLLSPYSDTRSFTKTWASWDNLPELLMPPTGALLTFFDAETFSWNPIPGAVQYKFQVATSENGFNTPLYNITTYSTRHQPNLKFSNSTYYWQVVPLDAAARPGTASEVRQFEMSYDYVPVLLEPANQVHLNFTPTFRWTAVPGAQDYILEYATTSDFTQGKVTITTPNTSYTPLAALENQKTYYWRVSVKSGLSISAISEERNFFKQWNLKPQLLTPPNNYINIRFPFYSWTPVPGASYYTIEIDDDPGFGSPYLKTDTANTFYIPAKWESSLAGDIMFWRVTPYDGAKNAGVASDSGQHTSNYAYTPVDLIYPEYYYEPDALFVSHEDRTAPLPLFIWHRVDTGFPTGYDYAYAYRVEVAAEPNFESILWSVVTQNQSAAPTLNNPFEPTPGQDYYWRVLPLNINLAPIDFSSQVWRARFDPGLWVNFNSATENTSPPALLRPKHGSESVENTPTLEWRAVRTPLPAPVFYADSYLVQISLDPSFAAEYLLLEDWTQYPAYTPSAAFARRLNGEYRFGSYYWRVKAYRNSVEMTGWSEIRRFQIAGQTQWQPLRGLGNPENQVALIGEDPIADVASEFDLSTFFMTQDKTHWYLGFEQQTGANMEYVIYIDLDHKDGSGATYDAKGYTLSTITGHRPEFAIYIPQSNREFAPNQVRIYQWNQTSSSWNPYTILTNIGGDIFPAELYGITYNDAIPTWAVGQYGNLIEWESNQWRSRFSPTYNTLYTIDAIETAAGAVAWAAGPNGNLIKYNAGLNSWAWVTPPTASTIRSLRLLNSKNGWAVGSFGAMLQYNGLAWSSKSALTTYNLTAVDFITSTVQAGKNVGLAVGEFGSFLKWNATSSKWEVQPAITSGHLYGVDIVQDDFAVAVGRDGAIFHWNGGNWSSQTSPVTLNLNAVAMYNPNLGLAVGDDGTILQWNGSQWQLISNSNLFLDLYAVDFNEDGNRAIIVGENGENILWENGAWQQIHKTITDYIELRIPNTAIGMQPDTGSAAVAVMAVNSSGVLVEVLPDDPQAASTGFVRYFANASERMNTFTPPDNALLGQNPQDPTVFNSVHPFQFDFPIRANWAGHYTEAHQDQDFTSPAGTIEQETSDIFYGQPIVSWATDLVGDDLYYWRTRPRYLDYGPPKNYYLGAWSEGRSFKRFGLLPQNMQTSVTFATPSFSWGMVEGAMEYQLQIDSDTNFNPALATINTDQTGYTEQSTRVPGVYYWRVRGRRSDGSVYNDWSPTQSFSITLPAPRNLHHYPNGIEPGAFPGAATLCWDEILEAPPGGEAVLAAWKYKVEISNNPSFSPVFESQETEHTCWTPTKAFPDGTYYWRVSMRDGDGRVGPVSATASFAKQYPVSTLISPLSGSLSLNTPTFSWNWASPAAQYNLQVSTDSLFGTKVVDITTGQTTYTPVIALGSQAYYWRVAIKDKAGNLGPYNTERIIVGAPKRNLYLPITRR